MRKSLPEPKNWSIDPTFSSRSFIVSGLIPMSLIHQQNIFKLISMIITLIVVIILIDLLIKYKYSRSIFENCQLE